MHVDPGPAEGRADVGADGAGAKNSDFHWGLRSRVDNAFGIQYGKKPVKEPPMVPPSPANRKIAAAEALAAAGEPAARGGWAIGDPPSALTEPAAPRGLSWEGGSHGRDGCRQSG
ncbi:hypothetical protein Plo01_39150 [Planobispora longispora]|uniref:Uncharacterized protein n=1 Tax=Planobispora longispora TaxID=28887 RepID=A0A8J3RJA1_9ACTN|nr:hypothetical protein Plo01_39150 [Planobispora longispora]